PCPAHPSAVVLVVKVLWCPAYSVVIVGRPLSRLCYFMEKHVYRCEGELTRRRRLAQSRRIALYCPFRRRPRCEGWVLPLIHGVGTE
ncbi:hypothetical protein DFP72DRAFT_875639, partial [Ephemerocybe angulata]